MDSVLNTLDEIFLIFIQAGINSNRPNYLSVAKYKNGNQWDSPVVAVRHVIDLYSAMLLRKR